MSPGNHRQIERASVHRDSRALAARIVELEEELERTRAAALEAGRLKDDFLATLSHELRTPLNSILGWIQLLRLHIGDRVEREHALEVLERNARAQVQIVSDLLDVSRVITGRMTLSFQEVKLSELIEGAAHALEPATSAKNQQLVLSFAPVGAVYGDPARLKQVVWNLMTNAVKFTPAGGHITVSLTGTNTEATLEVTDDGVGMRGDVVPHVFDRFRQGDSSLTRSFGGLGLGLAIVRHLVELHGGSVSAWSAGPNRGSTFRVRIPTKSAARGASS